VERVRTIGMLGELELLPRRERGEPLLLELPGLLFEALDLGCHLSALAAQQLEFADLAFEFDDRALELENLRAHGRGTPALRLGPLRKNACTRSHGQSCGWTTRITCSAGS